MVSVQGTPVLQDGQDAGALTAAGPEDILALYLRDGDGLFARLHGRFAIAIVDAARRSVQLAVDPMGIERMAWSSRGSAIVFGDSAEAIARFPAMTFNVRAQAIYDYLLLHMVPSPDTAFEGVHKLEPATLLTFREGRTTLRQ